MRVEVSAKTLSIPQECTCCGSSASGAFELSASKSRGKRVVHTQTRSWAFPACNSCLGHVRLWADGESAFLWTMVLAVFLGGAAFCLHPLASLAVFGALAAVAWWRRKAAQGRARACATSGCSDLADPAQYFGWNGTVHSFGFANSAYAAKFMESNSKKLVNLDSGQRALLASRERAQEVVEKAQDEVADFDAAIRRIESAKTPAGRRSALARALAEPMSPATRQRLHLEASRIEVEAALDKVDGLKTPTAKLRCLRQALDAIRADAVDDELQREQIQWLEQAISEAEKA